MREVIARSDSVRILGTRHSFNDIADTDGTLIALDRMLREIEVNGIRDAVRVSGGVRYGELAPILEEQEQEQEQELALALANLASLPHISVAGAIVTGTHGSGDGIGSLSAAVRALTVITAAGETRRFSRGEPGFDGPTASDPRRRPHRDQWSGRQAHGFSGCRTSVWSSRRLREQRSRGSISCRVRMQLWPSKPCAHLPIASLHCCW